MKEDVAAGLLADNVRSRVSQSTGPICVYWMQVLGDRDAYASALREALKPVSCAVIVVRRPVFMDPNSVMSDLAGLLAEHELECRESIDSGKSDDPLIVVFLSRSPLGVPQLSSPVVVPQWIPNIGGSVVSVSIEDMSRAVVAPLDSPEVATTELAEGLFRLEGLMLGRMNDMWRHDKQIADVFCGQLGRDGDPQFSLLLESMVEHRKSVVYAGAYRPSRRTANSLTARLWSVGQDRNSEEGGPAKALARCLGLREAGCSVKPSLFYVLRRPTNQPTSWEAAGRDVIVTVTTTCQLLTASAHADVYPTFSVDLIASASREMRESLRSWEQFLARLA